MLITTPGEIFIAIFGERKNQFEQTGFWFNRLITKMDTSISIARHPASGLAKPDRGTARCQPVPVRPPKKGRSVGYYEIDSHSSTNPNCSVVDTYEAALQAAEILTEIRRRLIKVTLVTGSKRLTQSVVDTFEYSAAGTEFVFVQVVQRSGG